MGSGQKFPDAPKLSQEYEKGLKVYLKYLPKMLRQEFGFREQYDPKYIEQALGLQHKYDPQLSKEQLDALKRRDPEAYAVRKGLGEKVSEALQRGYLDPRQEAAYDKWSKMAGQGDPTRDALYGALGKQYTGDVLRGGTASPEVTRQMTQAIMSRNPGLSHGEALDMATAVYTGQRSENLKQQRQQGAGQFAQLATPTQQKEQSLGSFYGQTPPEALAISEAGRFMGLPTNTQMMNQIGGVQAPSQARYVYPGAGYQGAQFGLQNYQNMLAQQAGGGGGGMFSQQGSDNPWMNQVQGVATGASYGSVGGPYGAAGGALVGSGAAWLGYPQFSDARLKNNISRTGLESPDGIPIVEYDYQGKRWRGILAQDVLKVRPDAVYSLPGAPLRVFYDRIGVEVREVKQNDQEDVKCQ